MSKYHVTYSCGHEGTVELFGKTSERERKLQWYADCAVCPDCYRAKKQAEEKVAPKLIKATFPGHVDDKTGEPMVSIYLTGDTKPQKEEIKAAGFKWLPMAEMLSIAKPPYYWQAIVKLSEVEEPVKKAEALGYTCDFYDMDINDIVGADYALHQQKRWQEKQAELAKLEKPKRPKGLNGTWNLKVYGKAGNYRVYLDGNETFITDEQAVAMKEYAEKVEAYNKAKENLDIKFPNIHIG